MGRYSGKTCRLSTMLLLTSSFFLVEIIVGYVTNSIALVADSFHMLSDVVALIVGFASVRISKWPSKRNTYGWVRAEILGALVNAVFLLALCFSILVEALKRLVEVEKVDNPKLLLIVGGAGLVVNLIGLFLFGHHGHSHGGHGHSHGGHGHSHGAGHHHHSEQPTAQDEQQTRLVSEHKDVPNGHSASPVESEMLVGNHTFHGASDTSTDTETAIAGQNKHIYRESIDDQEIFISPSTNITIDFKKTELASSNQLNMRGVFLHVLGDALGSVVVIVSALVIWFVDGDWKYYVDPAMSVVMVIIILSTTIPLLKESGFILLQTVPSHVNVENIIKELEQMEGIYGVHECHIWQLAGNRIVASAHIRCHGIEEYMDLASRIKRVFHNAGIHSTTIQPEFIDWQGAVEMDQACVLVCQSAGQLCTPNTCCGDKDSKKSKNQTSGDFAMAADKNNSSEAGDLCGLELKPPERLVNKIQQGASMFTSAHSLDVKFSPDGDEVVLELSDMAATDADDGDSGK